MHEKYAKDGLVVISLSVDDPDDTDQALAFLKKQNATFTNFILADKDRFEPAGEKKFEHSVPPIVHVFGRDGKPVKTLMGKKEIDELDDLVKGLLEKK
jgi:hypothetical protein